MLELYIKKTKNEMSNEFKQALAKEKNLIMAQTKDETTMELHKLKV